MLFKEKRVMSNDKGCHYEIYRLTFCDCID